MILADLDRAVRTALDTDRLGTPVFVRYLYHRTLNGPAVTVRLAQTTAVVGGWLGQRLERVFALGTAQGRHISLTLEYVGGATALVTWVGTVGRGAGVDITLLGNRGAIYHDAGMAELWDEPALAELAAPEPALVALIERALQTRQPENAEDRR